MEEYILIMRHPDGKAADTPEQIAIWMQQTGEWINSIAAQDKFISGTGLYFEDAKVVHYNDIVTKGVFGKEAESIGGFITIKAESIDEAIAFAKASPVLKGEGNTVEVRRIVKRK
ncbi:MAG: transcription initiation protein [Bacteroidota bacterium]|nr:transcription initiation protein [Bacteroidota bacterium]